MADNRMFIRCKGCGAKVFLAKLSLGIGWMTVKSAEQKGEELYEFIQEHENCCGDLDADIIGANFYSHEFEPFEIDYEMRPDFGHRLCAIERNWLKDINESEEDVTIKYRHKVDARLGEVAANPNDYATKIPVEVKRMLMVYRDDTRDFRKLAHNEPVTEWKQIVDAALQSARSETLNHYLETDMLWVDFLSDGTAIVFLGNHH